MNIIHQQLIDFIQQLIAGQCDAKTMEYYATNHYQTLILDQHRIAIIDLMSLEADAKNLSKSTMLGLQAILDDLL